MGERLVSSLRGVGVNIPIGVDIVDHVRGLEARIRELESVVGELKEKEKRWEREWGKLKLSQQGGTSAEGGEGEQGGMAAALGLDQHQDNGAQAS